MKIIEMKDIEKSVQFFPSKLFQNKIVIVSIYVSYRLIDRELAPQRVVVNEPLIGVEGL